MADESACCVRSSLSPSLSHLLDKKIQQPCSPVSSSNLRVLIGMNLRTPVLQMKHQTKMKLDRCSVVRYLVEPVIVEALVSMLEFASVGGELVQYLSVAHFHTAVVAVRRRRFSFLRVRNKAIDVKAVTVMQWSEVEGVEPVYLKRKAAGAARGAGDLIVLSRV